MVHSMGKYYNLLFSQMGDYNNYINKSTYNTKQIGIKIINS